jgi:prophage tail gpP-like protein
MFVMSGRDIAVTAIDWDADPTINLRSQTLNDVLTRLFRPLGMTVTFGIDTDGEREVRLGRRAGSRGLSSHRRTQNVDIFHPKPGERIWQLAETLCRRLGYLLWVAPGADGTFNVVVDVPNYDADSVFLFKHRWLDGSQSQATADSNVIDMDFDAQTANIPTAVTVYGRSCRGDTSAARMRATLTNTELSRFPIVSQNAKPRIRHLHASRARTSDHADQEAKRVIADSMRDFRIHSVSVQGHGQASNDQMNLFSINTMAHVKDSLAELDEAMLIHRVEFKGSRKAGQTTRVTLGTQGAVVLVPAESGSTGSSGSSGGGGGLDLGDITHF